MQPAGRPTRPSCPQSPVPGSNSEADIQSARARASSSSASARSCAMMPDRLEHGHVAAPRSARGASPPEALPISPAIRSRSSAPDRSGMRGRRRARGSRRDDRRRRARARSGRRRPRARAARLAPPRMTNAPGLTAAAGKHRRVRGRDRHDHVGVARPRRRDRLGLDVDRRQTPASCRATLRERRARAAGPRPTISTRSNGRTAHEIADDRRRDLAGAEHRKRVARRRRQRLRGRGEARPRCGDC